MPERRMHPEGTMHREGDLHGRRRGRNWGVFGGLMALVVLIFAVTVVKMGPEAGNPTAQSSWGEAFVEWIRG
jgi:hypothetical protein